MLKYGMGAAALSGVSLRRADADDGGGVGKTPFKTEPFIEPLPVPAIKKALNDTPTTTCLHLLSGGDKLASPRVHQLIEPPDFQPAYAYQLHLKQAYQRLHPAIPDRRSRGYDGITPGPN